MSINSAEAPERRATKPRPWLALFGWALLTNFLSESKTGYGVHVSIAKASAPSVIVAADNSILDDKTPTDDWVRHEATVDIPADGVAYIVSVKFYAPGGDVLIPSGLAEPERQPQLPQRYVELMARQRPIAPGIAEPLDRLDEMRVGSMTAKEVGWVR